MYEVAYLLILRNFLDVYKLWLEKNLEVNKENIQAVIEDIEETMESGECSEADKDTWSGSLKAKMENHRDSCVQTVLDAEGVSFDFSTCRLGSGTWYACDHSIATCACGDRGVQYLHTVCTRGEGVRKRCC